MIYHFLYSLRIFLLSINVKTDENKLKLFLLLSSPNFTIVLRTIDTVEYSSILSIVTSNHLILCGITTKILRINFNVSLSIDIPLNYSINANKEIFRLSQLGIGLPKLISSQTFLFYTDVKTHPCEGQNRTKERSVVLFRFAMQFKSRTGQDIFQDKNKTFRFQLKETHAKPLKQIINNLLNDFFILPVSCPYYFYDFLINIKWSTLLMLMMKHSVRQ